MHSLDGLTRRVIDEITERVRTEPIALETSGIGRLEIADQISMAFLVLVQKLTPAERGVLLLHDIFDFNHAEIAELLGKTQAACRQLLSRAKQSIASGRRSLTASIEEHRRLLSAFLDAVNGGEVSGIERLLADDAVMIADGGARGVRIRGVRNLPGPLTGADKIATFIAAFARRPAIPIETHRCELNGQPALVALQGGKPLVAILLAVAAGRIERIFLQADPARLQRPRGPR